MIKSVKREVKIPKTSYLRRLYQIRKFENKIEMLKRTYLLKKKIQIRLKALVSLSFIFLKHGFRGKLSSVYRFSVFCFLSLSFELLL